MKEVTVSKELFDRTFKEKCEWQDKYWKAYDELVEQDREIERLNKENTILRQNSQYLVKQKDELEELINKAIEYIEKRKNLNWYADGVFVYELLNILQGVDKE